MTDSETCVQGHSPPSTTLQTILENKRRKLEIKRSRVKKRLTLEIKRSRENERLKLEIERLKSENEKIKWMSEAKYAANTMVRRKEIKMTIKKAQDLDLCFLLDATSSMLKSIEMVKNKMTTMAANISAAHPECSLRVSFVLYRDYDDHEKDLDEGCNFTTDFSGSESTFIKALSVVRATGGGDTAEDVFTGLQRVADLDWRAGNRLLVHIGDSPCHGTQFHNLRSEKWSVDDYPNGDKLGRSITSLLRQLHDHCQVTHYLFCHLNNSTRKMMQEFKKVIREDGWIEEATFGDIESIPENVVSISRSTITKTMSNLSAGIGSHAVRFVPQSVVEIRPNWESIAILDGQQYKHKWYPSVDELLKKINNRESFEVEKMKSVRVQIATHPFSAEGNLRWPYHAEVLHTVLQSHEATKSMVVKRFKEPFANNVRLVHSKERYLSQMEVQTVAAHMAHDFNHRTQSEGLRGVKKVEFSLVSTLEVGSEFYNMEKFLDGNWIRYSNNAGYVNTAEYAATLQAFTHWTHERSNGKLMVTDLQGVAQPTGKGSKYTFWLCDPAIHCLDLMRFTKSNFGEDGFKLFFSSHKCNDICLHLGLKSLNGYSKVGTKAYCD